MNIYTIYLFFLLSVVSSSDYYDLLGVSKDADDRDIRKAFKKLALKLHPDKTQGSKENTHEQFIAINKAYEVLKDEQTRKKYDLYGEEGLKEDFGKSWKGNYRSWNYYSESFGIYDDDPEIITLNRHDFAQSVLESSELWFVNFYSPQCSHCHHLAPAWRQLSLKLHNVIYIGAVNCEDEWILCRQQNIHSYPSLILYPKREKYHGSRDFESLMDFVLQYLPDNVIKLKSRTFKEVVSKTQYPKPWLIFHCSSLNSPDCFDHSDLKMLSSSLKNMINIAMVSDTIVCEKIECKPGATFYPKLNLLDSTNRNQHINSSNFDLQSLVNMVIELLPDPNELSKEKLEEILSSKKRNTKSSPFLIQFIKGKTESIKNIELKRLIALIPEVSVGYFDCDEYPMSCSSVFITKNPTFILFKDQGFYEFYHGKITVHDVVRFTKEALLSNVYTLTPDKFPDIISSNDIWFIDFFAPWCPPCMELLPHWRIASQKADHAVKFGTVDCSTHVALCRKHSINSYPTTILYNSSVPFKYGGSHSHDQIVDFIEDILHPSVVSLSPETFQSLVQSKNKNEIWVVDFFAPWCGPCQQLAPQWRKLAKMLDSIAFVHIGEINCQLYSSLCDSMGVNSYPTINLYPRGIVGTKTYFTYNGRSRNAASLQAWIYEYLPSKVETLESAAFKKVLSDSKPWVIDFFTPWCGHCQVFAPEYEKLAEKVSGKVKAGKVNCDRYPDLCRMAGIRAYPTVLFYEGNKEHSTQNPIGDEIETHSSDGIYTFLDKRLGLSNNQHQKMTSKDEL